MLTVAIPDNGL